MLKIMWKPCLVYQCWYNQLLQQMWALKMSVLNFSNFGAGSFRSSKSIDVISTVESWKSKGISHQCHASLPRNKTLFRNSQKDHVSMISCTGTMYFAIFLGVWFPVVQVVGTLRNSQQTSPPMSASNSSPRDVNVIFHDMRTDVT